LRTAGELKFVNPEEIVVGDLVKLKAGDGIPADGILVEVSCHSVRVILL
jgi:magnesium-transporting ATPase (P-type)